MEEWKDCILGDIAVAVKDRIDTSVLDRESYISTENMLPDKAGVSVSSGLPSGNAIKFQVGDVLISNIRPYFKKIWRANCIGGCSADVICLRATDEVESLFLYYLLSQNAFFDYVMLGAKGTKMPRGDRKQILQWPLSLPSMKEQRVISSFLKSLDDKIEVNRRINDNLEQQAQALFKSWFVDFEPFKDGQFVESEMGRIPKNMSVKRVSEIPHTIETGRRPKGGVGEITSGVPSVGAEHVKGLGNYDYSKTKYITEEYAASLKTGKVNGYELLIYKDGGKPGYFIPNYSIFGEGYPFEECFLNEHVFKLDFGNKGYNAFCYFYFWTDYVMNYLNAQGGKAAIPGINRQDIENIQIYAPENELVKRFGDIVLPSIRQILFNCKESRRLAQLRDALLPRLMSGELKVNEIEMP